MLGNAIKFSPQGSLVTVAVHANAVDCVFTVSDQGVGIKREDIERVFEQFEQVERGDTRKYGGTGLGLSISRSLVQLHGGAIWAESEVGRGSSFGFRLPLAGPAAEPALPRVTRRPVTTAKDLHP